MNVAGCTCRHTVPGHTVASSNWQQSLPHLTCGHGAPWLPESTCTPQTKRDMVSKPARELAGDDLSTCYVSNPAPGPHGRGFSGPKRLVFTRGYTFPWPAAPQRRQGFTNSVNPSPPASGTPGGATKKTTKTKTKTPHKESHVAGEMSLHLLKGKLLICFIKL